MRKLRREVAKVRMKWAGIRRLCSKTGNRKNGKSYFAAHWREFA